jgi:hypothetical protein
MPAKNCCPPYRKSEDLLGPDWCPLGRLEGPLDSKSDFYHNFYLNDEVSLGLPNANPDYRYTFWPERCNPQNEDEPWTKDSKYYGIYSPSPDFCSKEFNPRRCDTCPEIDETIKYSGGGCYGMYGQKS